MKNKIKILLFALVFGFGLVGCDLDVSNPNSPTNEDLKTYDGIRMTAIGMQARLSQAIGDFNTVSGMVSGELNPIIGYVDYMPMRKFPDVVKRVRLEKTNSYCVTLWRVQYQVMKSAQDILNNIDAIAMDDTVKKNITALAECGKAMTIYHLITHFEKIAVDINAEHPAFVDRAGAIAEGLRLLNDAENKTSMGISATVTKNVIGAGFDLRNTIRAYKAKFLLMKGDYAGAAASAAAVTAESQYNYTATGTNPLYENYVRSKFSAALKYWVKGAEAGDKRINATVDTATGTSMRQGVGLDTACNVIKYSTSTTPYKIYTLNEMALIKAEAYVRGGGGDAVAEVNKVRTAAGLPAYSGTSAGLLKEIFVQRFYELFSTAQHWEDLRRFKNDGIDIVNDQRANQLAHEYLVYPYTEIDTNPNCPAQPTLINYGF